MKILALALAILLAAPAAALAEEAPQVAPDAAGAAAPDEGAPAAPAADATPDEEAPQPTQREVLKKALKDHAAKGGDARPGRFLGSSLLTYSQGDRLQLKAIGLLQTHLAFFTGDDNLIADGDPAEQAGFRIRRARLGVAGQAFRQHLAFELSFEATPDGAALLDAWVGFTLMEELGVTVGAKKLPFSRFMMLGASKQVLHDRSMGSKAMAPARQVGLAVEGDIADGAFIYSLGAYNGFERRTNFHEGYVENAALEGNRFNNIAFAGRLASEPLGELGPHIADLRAEGERGDFLLGVGGAFYYNAGKTTESMGAEGDVHLKVAGLHFLGEFLWDTASPKSVPATPSTIPTDITRMAFAGEFGYAFPLLRRMHLAFAARVEWIDDNTAREDEGDAMVVTGGVTLHWMRHHVMVGVDFTHREELKGVLLNNNTGLLHVQFAL